TKQSFCVGDPDQRGTNDRPAHRVAAGLELKSTRIKEGTMSTTARLERDKSNPAWQGFNPGLWQKEINVRDFIQQNYHPYEEDDSFLAGPTERTQKIWKQLTDLFVEERKKGVLDISQIR